jgi:hypothetical protein
MFQSSNSDTATKSRLQPIKVYAINRFMSRAGMLPNAHNGEAPVDRLQIINATRILAGRQGLYEVFLGCMFLSMELCHFWPKSWPTRLASLALPSAFVGAYKRWIPDYYRRRFGVVESNEPTARQFGILLAVLLGLLIFSFLFGDSADSAISKLSIRLHILMSDPEQQIMLGPFFIWTVFLLPGSRWSRRRIQLGQSFFGLCGLTAFGSVVLLAATYPEVKQIALWRILNACGLGLTLVALGLYDHFSLVLFLPNRIAQDNDE